MPPKKRAAVDNGTAAGVKVALARETGSDAGEDHVALVNRKRAEFEREFLVQLPESYVELCQRYTAPSLQRCHARFARVGDRQLFSVDRIASIAGERGDEDERTLPWESDEMSEEWHLPDATQGKFILLGGDGHVWLALCYKPDGKGKNPCVVGLLQYGEGGGRKPNKDADKGDNGGSGDDGSGSDDGGDDEDGFEILPIAESFDKFLDILEFHEGNGGAVVVIVPSAQGTHNIRAEEMLGKLNALLTPQPELVIDGGALKTDDITVGGVKLASISFEHNRMNNTELAISGAVAGSGDVWFATVLGPEIDGMKAAAEHVMRCLRPAFSCAILSEPIDLGVVVA